MNAEGKTYQLLKDSSNIVVATIAESTTIADERFYFCLNSFAIYGIPNVRTPRELVSCMHEKDPICAAKGFERYQRDILDSLLPRPLNHKPKTFILPIIDGDHFFYLTMSMNYNEKENSRVFVFSTLDIESYDMKHFMADAVQDRLTGLFNFQTLKDHLKTNDRDGYLCLFDLNKFKPINDTYGHGFGDNILEELATYLISICSDKIVFYRRSGDEFFILYFGSDIKAIRSYVRRINAHLAAMGTKIFPNHPLASTSAAFGIVELRYGKDCLHLFDENNFCDSILLADIAMYQAKNSGKATVLIKEEQAKKFLQNGNLEQRLDELASKAGR